MLWLKAKKLVSVRTTSILLIIANLKVFLTINKIQYFFCIYYLIKINQSIILVLINFENKINKK